MKPWPSCPWAFIKLFQWKIAYVIKIRIYIYHSLPSLLRKSLMNFQKRHEGHSCTFWFWTCDQDIKTSIGEKLFKTRNDIGWNLFVSFSKYQNEYLISILCWDAVINNVDTFDQMPCCMYEALIVFCIEHSYNLTLSHAGLTGKIILKSYKHRLSV